ncbi:sigma factor-like helix-turn-helix DNA-binding protein [Bdellovibrionota bacterium FG-1]
MTSTIEQMSQHVLQLYGDMLFDLCEAVLWNPVNTQLAFKSILKTLRNRAQSQSFQEYERAWVLRVATEKLLAMAPQHGRRLTPSEQIQLDAAQNPSIRLKQFNAYFHRLSTEDQILLLLRDKYGIPYPELSTALGLPEGTIKLRRAQALRAIEEWLWDSA